MWSGCVSRIEVYISVTWLKFDFLKLLDSHPLTRCIKITYLRSDRVGLGWANWLDVCLARAVKHLNYLKKKLLKTLYMTVVNVKKMYEKNVLKYKKIYEYFGIC